MKKIIGMVGFCFVLLISMEAQEEADFKNNEWILRAGINQTLLKDLNYAPISFMGIGKCFNFDYVRKNDDEEMFNISLEFNSNKLNAKASDYFESSEIYGHLEIGYLKSLEPPSNRFNLYVGGQLRSSLYLATLIVQDAFTFFIHHDLRAKTMATYKLGNRSMLASSLSIPLLAYMGRPPYNGYDDELIEALDNLSIIFKGQLATINHYLNLEWGTEYRFQLINNLDLSLAYNLRFHRIYKDLPLRNFENQLKAGFILKY